MPEQVQTAPGTRRGDVQQSGRLEAILVTFEFAQVSRDRFVIAADRTNRRHQQLCLAICGRALQPVQQFTVAAAGTAPETGQYHAVELESLGLVHRHELNTAVGVAVGRGVQAVQGAREAREIDQSAGLGAVVEQTQEGLRVIGRRIAGGGKPAQAQPDALDPLAQGAPSACRQLTVEQGDQAFHTSSAVAAERSAQARVS